jgi:hypothetical protein
VRATNCAQVSSLVVNELKLPRSASIRLPGWQCPAQADAEILVVEQLHQAGYQNIQYFLDDTVPVRRFECGL